MRSGVSLGRIAPFATAALAAVFAFRKIDDSDTWWHLAAGRWMVTHGRVPATDPLSHTVRDHVWVNLEWAFQVAIYLLHSMGGPVLLCLAATVGYTLAVWLVLRLVRPHMGEAAGALFVLVVVLIAQDRFVVRPEMVSFPLLVAILSLLEAGRRREGRGLWLLVPLMIVWVNVHGLFVIGAFAIVCAIAGAIAARLPLLPAAIRAGSSWDAASSRRLALWGGASLLATAVNPFGLHGVLLPAKLFTLIDKSNPALQTIGEFRSPFAADAGGISIALYRILLIVGTAAVLAALVVSSRRVASGTASDTVDGPGGFDLGGFFFLLGLAVLSAVARRNAALFAIGAAPFLARSAGTIAAALPARLRENMRRTAPVAAAAVVCGVLVLGVLVVTSFFYKWNQQPREFGGGVIEGTFPIRAAAFAREAKLPPKLYNDIAAGGYLAWDDPIGEGVFIDGRLEVYDTRFYTDYVTAMYDQAKWESEADRLGIQTVILFHHWENRRLLLERLVKGGIWSLVYADEVAVVFVRARGNEQVIARAGPIADRWNQATREWIERPVPKGRYPAGRVEGTRAFARLLATIGDPEGAAEQFTRVLELGVPVAEEIDIRLRLARFFAATGRAERARAELTRVLALAPDNREAREMLGGTAAETSKAK